MHRTLDSNLDKKVILKCKGGKEIRWKLRGCDQHMNILLDGAEEVIYEGEEKERIEEEEEEEEEESEKTKKVEKIRKLGTIILRGDNVIVIQVV